jgi:hypothetical protein
MRRILGALQRAVLRVLGGVTLESSGRIGEMMYQQGFRDGSNVGK